MKEYKNEEEFLKDYDPNKFDRLSLTTDILIFSVSDGVQENYRKLNRKYFSVLLVKRDNYPFKDKWCLPGGFVKIDEDIEDAAKRILKEEANISDIYIEQLYTYGDPKRDPRTRVISTSYMALIDKNKLKYDISKNASWFNVIVLEDEKFIDITLDNGNETIKYKIKKTLKEKTTDRFKYEVVQNDKLAFDHALVITSGISRLKNKIEYTDIVFNMMPEYFTLGELQQVYEVILGKKLLDPAFRRIIANKVEKTNKMKTGEGHRPSALFRYKK
ncbi:aDP-ribose pyrophosphatase [Clostridium sp. CAG:433]|mgnify:FL=1|nr:aDP-ribose pyrophosphatase [Clostridium sp. CAG:433]